MEWGPGIHTLPLGDEGKAMQTFWKLGAAAPDLCARTHQMQGIMQFFEYESLIQEWALGPLVGSVG